MRSHHQMIHRLLSNIQFGQITISDANGRHVFKGSSGDTTHSVNLNIHNMNVYKKLIFNGSIAAGETYMTGDWDVDDLTLLIEIIIKNTEIFSKMDGVIPKLIHFIMGFKEIFYKNNLLRAKKNIHSHYDLGNEFFQLFLDPSMMYSCALYESDNSTLAEASLHKIDRICQQLQLSSSDHLLEIGTGWGGVAIHAALQYGCKVTTTTISDKQYAYVKQKIVELGLQHQIELLNLDYRNLTGQYDKLVSVEMIEAIGYKNFDNYFQKCCALTKENGLFFLQAILINDQAYSRAKNEMDFIKKYIFPGGCLPSMRTLSNSIADHTQFQLMHLQDIGIHYDKTLTAWLMTFNQNIDAIRQQGYDESFIRMWRYYFSYCIAAFRLSYITDIHALWRKR